MYTGLGETNEVNCDSSKFGLYNLGYKRKRSVDVKDGGKKLVYDFSDDIWKDMETLYLYPYSHTNSGKCD